MPHHKSAIKRVRQTKTRTERNKAKITMVKTAVKKVRSAISSGDKNTATSALSTAQKLLARLAKHGVIKPNTAARKTGRLAKAVGKLSS